MLIVGRSIGGQQVHCVAGQQFPCEVDDLLVRKPFSEGSLSPQKGPITLRNKISKILAGVTAVLLPLRSR